MNLKDILAISGESSLFKFVAQGKNAIIVQNIENGKRMSAMGTTKVSALEEIAIFTTSEEVPLAKVMDIIWDKENGGAAISHKAPEADLTKYFGEILPEYDRQRVYTSDIKKVFQWYNFLQQKNLLVKEEVAEAEKEVEAAPEITEKPKVPVKKQK